MNSTIPEHAPVIFDNRDIARYTRGERRMPMRGFDPEYTDIVDYIIRITHRIWEEKAIGYIYETYQHNCVLHGSSGDVHGREAVVAATLQSLAACPDDRTIASDVIWSGNEDDGFHTSHLIHGTARNSGWSSYGPPTNRKLTWRTIANCLARDNMIFEEWILRDETSVIRQMGLDLDEIVQRQAHALLVSGNTAEPVGDIAGPRGQYAPARYVPRSAGRFEIEDFIRDTYNEIWNRRMFNVIPARYASSTVGYMPGNTTLHGSSAISGFLMNLFGMFPDLGVTVDQVYANGDDTQGYHVAVRWTLSGTHTGYGIYGDPSAARVRVMGLSQHHVQQGQITKEYMFLDEMEILRRIALRRLVA